MRARLGSSIAFAAVLVLAIYPFGRSQITAESGAVATQVDELCAAAVAKDDRASVTVGIVSGGTLMWAKSYGFADMEKKTPASRDTVYRIGSITKQFTALMLLQLVHDGKVHFSDPVEKYFPEVNKLKGRFPGASPITLIQLATHTSGLAREPDHTDKYLKGSVSDWEKVLIDALDETKYAFEPGTQFSYSNIGYAILGAALGRAAGQPYTEYIQARIFKPLGMADTAFEPNDRIRARIARGYVIRNGNVDWETADREHQGRGYKVPNGAIYTTVGDLSKFLIFELGGGPESVLDKLSLEQNFKRIITVGVDGQNGYGLGFALTRAHNDLVLLGHDGAVAGYQASAFFNRKSKAGVIILRNALGRDDKFDAEKLMLSLFDKIVPVTKTTALMTFPSGHSTMTRSVAPRLTVSG
jgi:CubicO group peptidase (beta-lactamase class C family)